MTQRSFQIDVDAVGPGRVVVDGVDLSDQVDAFSLVAQRDQVTTLTLEQRAGAGPITGVGLVQAAAPGDMVEQLAQLIESLDPEELEQKALDSPDLDNEPCAVTRQVLREAAAMLRAGR